MNNVWIKVALLLGVLLSLGREASAIDNADVVVIAGQSNAVGYGIGPGVDPVSDSRVWQWAINGTAALAANPLAGPDSPYGRYGAGLHFGITYANTYLATGRKVLLVPTAVMATGFSDSRWDVGDDLYLQAIGLAANAVNSGRGNRLVAIIWLQGETDARNGLDAPDYQNNLIALIRGFRSSIPTATVKTPFLIGGMVPEWMATMGKPAYDIAAVHMTIPTIEPYCAYVGGPWGYNNGGQEVIHYNAVGQAKLGDRYAAALATVGPLPSTSPAQLATVRGVDNALWIKGYDGTRWSYWGTLGGVLHSDAAVVRSPSGAWDVFALGQDDLLWTRGFNGGAWSVWTPLGSPNSILSFVGRPTVVQTQNGRLDVVVTGADETLWTRNRQNGVWSNWLQLPGAALSPTSFTATPDGGALLLAWGWVGGAWANTLSKTGTWSGWVILGGSPAAEVNGAANWDGDVDVFTIAADKSVQTMHMIKNKPGTWQSLGGIVSGNFLWPVAEKNEDMTVIAKAGDNSLWGRTRNFETGPWGNWYKVAAGGVVNNPPTLVQDAAGNLYFFGLNTSGSFSAIYRISGVWSSWANSN